MNDFLGCVLKVILLAYIIGFNYNPNELGKAIHDNYRAFMAGWER